MSILEIHELTRHFGEFTAVDSLTLSVESGEVFGLLGPNGAGKSTAIKMLITLLKPSAGSASIAGLDIVRDAPRVRAIIGYVPQMLSVDGTLTAEENLRVFARLYGISRRERESRINDSLEFMGLADVANKLVREYSGGMIRRLEIAQAMLHRPRVLFLDEPTVGLDPIAREAVWGHIEDLRNRYGTTILLTTHYMDEAESLCRRVAFMHLGKLAAIGAPDELKAALGRGATLDDVFAHYTGAEIETGGSYRDTSRTRRVPSRLG